jgi:hypothetical protein
LQKLRQIKRRNISYQGINEENPEESTNYHASLKSSDNGKKLIKKISDYRVRGHESENGKSIKDGKGGRR